MALHSKIIRAIVPFQGFKIFEKPFFRPFQQRRFLPSYTIKDPIVSESLDKTDAYSNEREMFLNQLPEIINSLTHDGVHQDMPTVNNHLERCIKYNLSNGKLNRGLLVPHTFKLLTVKDQQSPDILKRANVLGWCVELLQGSFVIANDVIKGTSDRRGQPCWYKNEDIGMVAVNDGILLETCIYTLLHEHFHDQQNYLDTLDAFIYTTRHTAMGQSLDLLSCYSQDPKVRTCKLEDFNMKRYTAIVKYKSSYCSFYLPVQLGMGLAGVRDPELYRQARTILLEMGHFFQIQNDYQDCYVKRSDSDAIGATIKNGKCSWLITVALQRANKDQKEVLRKSYGSDNGGDVASVMGVFEDLKIPKLYKSYEEDTVRDILDLINRMSGGIEKRTLNHQIFKSLLANIYKRN